MTKRFRRALGATSESTRSSVGSVGRSAPVSRKKRALATVGTTLALVTATLGLGWAAPASAAVPGARCDINSGAGEVLLVSLPGTVASDGNTCVPNGPVAPELSALDAGLPCGTEVQIDLLILTAYC
ncbi:hypothetical protein [Streptomyces sp. NPDC020983]|uniref:hypothetical protein n=1 Tax=Streptomyces sp. NPDC020983 TaxID=3365106 RepID=UPI0037A2743B